MPILSDEETMIADTVAGVLRSSGGLGRVRRLSDAGAVPLVTIAARNGWTGLLVPEAQGGAGMELRDALVLMRTAGTFVPPEPIAGIIATAAWLAETPGQAQLLEQAIDGTRTVLFCRARRVDGQLVGEAGSGLASADTLAFLEGPDRMEIVPRDDARMTLAERHSIDGGTLGWATLAAPASVETVPGAIQRLLRRHRLLLAAELVGIGQEAASRARAHISTRRQFGRPLSGFQVLQHRAASVHVQLSAADALLFEAARGLDGPWGDLAATAALRQAGRAAMLSCKESVQFHGAMGIAEESDIGMFLRRCMVILAICETETVSPSAMV